MLYKVLLDIKTLAADGKKVEEGILPTHIGCTGRVTECQVAVIECADGKHGPFLTGNIFDPFTINRISTSTSRQIRAQGKGTWPCIVVGKFRERGYKIRNHPFHITVLTKRCIGVENGQGFGRGCGNVPGSPW